MQPITDEICVGEYSNTVDMVIQYLIENYEVAETDARNICNLLYCKNIIISSIIDGLHVCYVGDQIADHKQLNVKDVNGEDAE